MNVLLLPKPGDDEGPAGYRMRVAEANLLPYRWVAQEELDVDGADVDAAPVFQRWRSLKCGPGIWVNRRARWCPVCLAEHGRGRIGWELLFADACAGCGHWLLDACSACGEPVTWLRHALARCACGANLCDQPSRMAPPAVVRLTRSMEQLALGLPDGELPHLSELSISQCSRLVRVLGAYGSARHQRAPQKIVGADTLDVSWTISTVAAEILADWPSGLHRILSKPRGDGNAGTGRMAGVFGGFYRALYKGLKDREFDWVREAFEDYIAENWTGAIGKRNRRMPAAVLARMSWLPAPEAASLLGISTRRLAFLIESGRVAAKHRVSPTGREFAMVRRADVEALAKDVTSDVSLAEASVMLGIKRQRLSRLLPQICPDATKVTLQGTPWLIPNAWANGWFDRISRLPTVRCVPEGGVSLDHLLRYGPLGDQAIAALLNDIESANIIPIGRLDSTHGLPAIVLDRTQLMDTHGRHPFSTLSVPVAAEWLGVKQEVAYALIRLGLLHAEERAQGRRTAACVDVEALKLFQATYVFATELAKACGRSPKAIVAALTAEGIDAAAGPGHGTCRQAVYARGGLKVVPWLSSTSS